MSFNAENFNNVSVGPVKIFSYITGNMVATGAGSYFTSTNCPGLSAGDLILCQFMSTGSAATALSILAVKEISTVGATFTYLISS